MFQTYCAILVNLQDTHAFYVTCLSGSFQYLFDKSLFNLKKKIHICGRCSPFHDVNMFDKFISCGGSLDTKITTK